MQYYNDRLLMIQEENDKDMDYFKQFYPQSMTQIQEIIEDECDKLEYQGSMMFDEHPDKWALKAMSNKIYDRARPPRPDRPHDGNNPHRPSRDDNNLWDDIIQVLLFNEMSRRRCRFRNCSGRW